MALPDRAAEPTRLPAGELDEDDVAAVRKALESRDQSLLDRAEQRAESLGEITDEVARARNLLAWLSNGGSLGEVAGELEHLLGVFRRRCRQGRVRDAVRLAELLFAALTLTRKWTETVALLREVVTIGREAGETADAAWAADELGRLEAACGLSPQGTAPPTDPGSSPSSALGKAVAHAAAHKAAAIVAAGVVAAGGVGVAIAASDTLSGGPKPRATIVKFDSSDTRTAPARPPEDAADPGGIVNASCDDSYLWIWADFRRMQKDDAFQIAASHEGEPISPDSGRWSGPSNQMRRYYATRTENGALVPVPAGRWRVTIRVEGKDAASARVTVRRPDC